MTLPFEYDTLRCASFRAFTGFEGFVTQLPLFLMNFSWSFRAFTGFEGFVTNGGTFEDHFLLSGFRAFTGFEGFVTAPLSPPEGQFTLHNALMLPQTCPLGKSGPT